MCGLLDKYRWWHNFMNPISNLFIVSQYEDRWIVNSFNFIDSMFGDDEFFILSCENNLGCEYTSVNFDFLDVMNDLASFLVVDMSIVKSEEVESRDNTRNMFYVLLNAEVGFVSARPKIGMMSPKKKVCEEDDVKAEPSGGALRAIVRMLSLRKRI
ncbi:hypothetical protein C1H46_031609 [Malus baccata]|uniref:Uncharacterized protein n=1 Tax=Malus baccata TaxID=106549 RepID=A0A540L8K9_MALBA|nr:hypothetical protein C1H46_031609 [Malus baccata]